MKKTTFSKPIRDNNRFKAQIQKEFPDWKLKHVDFTKEIRLTKGFHSIQVSLLPNQTRLISGLNFFYHKLLLILGVGFAFIVIFNETVLSNANMGLSPITVAVVFFVYLILVVIYYEKLDEGYKTKSQDLHKKLETIIKKMI